MLCETIHVCTLLYMTLESSRGQVFVALDNQIYHDNMRDIKGVSIFRSSCKIMITNSLKNSFFVAVLAATLLIVLGMQPLEVRAEDYYADWGTDGTGYTADWGTDGTGYTADWGTDGSEYYADWGSDGSDYYADWGSDGSDYYADWGTDGTNYADDVPSGVNYLDDVPVNYLDDVPANYLDDVGLQYSPDCGCYEQYIYEEGVMYTESSSGSFGSSGSQFASASMPSFSMPSFGRAPSTSYAPSYPQPRPQPQPVYQQPRQQQQQQQQQQGGGQPINIVNTNTNTNTNTNVNTAPVTPVYQAPVTYPVQYVYPQQPTYPTQNTYCVLSASPSSITNGQASYLTWSSTGATSAWLSDGIGQVAVNGSLAVRPNNSKMYTLTVSGYGGTNTCTAYVTVQGSYVSLSQIPYTGFDAGLLGNALYWLSLVSFAVAGAYLTVYYLPRNVFGGAGTASTLAFAGSTLRARKQNIAMHETVKVPEASKVEVVEKPIETMTPSPIDVMEFLPVASVAHSTKDAMTVLPSNDGGAPRIVITRS